MVHAPAEPTQRGWDWFSVQLDNGTELMLFQLRRMDGTIDPYSSGTYIARDGRSTHLKRADFRAPAAGLVDQSEDRRQISDALADPRSLAAHRAGLRRRAVHDQELAAEDEPPRATGKARLCTPARTRGVGYLEMTGYAKPMRL